MLNFASDESVPGSIYTALIWSGDSPSLRQLASSFGLTRPQSKAERHHFEALAKIVDRMVQDSWLLEHSQRSGDLSYLPNLERVFEFYASDRDKAVLERFVERVMKREVTSLDHLPRYIEDIANIVLAKLILGEGSFPSHLVQHWEQRNKKVFPRAVAPCLAERFGTHIPASIWHERMPEELKSDYVVQVAQSHNLRLKKLPDFWRAELEKTSGSRAKASRSYIEACESPLDLSSAPMEKQRTKPKALESFRRLFWSGRYKDAYDAGCTVLAANQRMKDPQIRGLEGLDMMLCAIAVSGEVPNGLVQAQEWSDKRHLAAPAPMDLFSIVHEIVASIYAEKEAGLDMWVEHVERDDKGMSRFAPRLALMVGLGLVWTNASSGLSAKDRTIAIRYLESVLEKQDPLPAVQRELEGVIAAIRGKRVETPCLANAFQTKSSWERLLDRLQSAVAPETPVERPDEKKGFVKHISWEIEVGGTGRYAWLSIEPRIISSARSTRGKPASLRTLRERYEDLFNQTDREVMLNLKLEDHNMYYAAGTPVSLDLPALVNLIGHPHVQNKHGDPLKIEEGIIELQVKDSKKGLRVSVKPKSIASGPAIAWETPDDHRLVVYQRPPTLTAALEIFGKSDVVIPQEGAARLTPILQSMAKHCRVVTDGAVMEGQTQQESDPSIYVSLRWSGSILWVDPQVLPFGSTDLCCFPGRGDVHITQSLDGSLCTATRDLDLEQANLDTLLQACPHLQTLSRADFEQGEVCRIDDLEDALTVTMELAQADAQLSWESEQILTAPNAADDSRFKIRLGKARDWFETDLCYQADADQVLGFQELIDARIGDSRFVRIGKNKVIALSKSMRRRLDRIAGMGEVTENGVKSSLTSLPVIHSLVSDFKDLELDQDAAAQLKDLRRALAYKPSVPKSLKASLRPYQEEGYTWICRLAKAQLGACLADDMGLGKTVQTLALLCKRQTQGSALVIAPASVVQNWIDEAHRFAPKLTVMDLSDLRHDFDPEALGPKDLVVASYGIMTKEIEKLEGVHFSTLVFDEAHALKNWGTRRTQAAARIKADFRLGLTGTPVENHVGEIWSLFQVLVPGLLGTKKQFEAKYSLPGAGAVPDIPSLRAQLEPFLLRRTKSQVLTELPELNESVLKVVPSPSEVAFYRALQKSALEACEKAASSGDPDKRLRVLAEITRLRQAAVDPRLIDDLLGPEGEKIQLLLGKLESLRKEGHRALVFTQFLGSLALVKDALEQSGIEYFELTGATPPKARAKMIASFQEGERDVFLISLRAGGVGVNLTGADYVFHLDPWWNPAVEDQATARAHRMGQTKPVQVYRLITAGTIEEKITEMHKLKRGLAEDLLGNLDKAKKLTLNQLRGLLSDEQLEGG